MPPNRRVRVALVAVAIALAACNNSTSPSPATSTAASAPASSEPSTAPSASPSTRPSPSAANLGGNPEDVAVKLTTLVGGLASPLFVTGAGDGSGRLFVIEQEGRIRIVKDKALVTQPFLDIAKRISSGGERGLLGLAFHPHYGTDERRFYVDYTNTDGDTVIAEYQATSTDPDVADPGSEKILLTIKQPFANHNGGMLAFGPDGHLYVGMGDGGSGGDPQGNGQKLTTLLGKILRLDVDHASANRLYGTDGNPLVDRSGARPEIWAYGVRNPWRFSFDRITGDLWIGDVGQGAWEEVDRATAASGGGAGLNFGWNGMEGAHCFEPSSGCDQSGLTLPIAEIGHEGGNCSITGGYVSRGRGSPALAGVYVFSDYCSGTIWGLNSAGPDSQKPVILEPSRHSVSSFGEDDDANLYLTDIRSGEVIEVSGLPR